MSIGMIEYDFAMALENAEHTHDVYEIFLPRTSSTRIEDNAENDRNIMVQGVCPFGH